MTTVYLVPPILKAKTILQELTCTRPVREGCFNISAEMFRGKSGEKLIVNCFGHGGSGWTTLFGSIQNAIELFENRPGIRRNDPIRVIGAGCMGLTAAIELARRGYNVVGITAKDLYDIPSWRAAGYFALVSLKTSPEEQKNLDLIGENTFKTIEQIDRNLHPYISSDAVRFMPVFSQEQTVTGIESFEARGLIPEKEDVVIDFGNGVRHGGFLKYMTYFLDTTKIMQQLAAEVKRLRIPIAIKAIDSFDEVEEETIFNCTGMAGRVLSNDDRVMPVRGHLIVLDEASGTEHMDYMIYTKVIQEGRDEYIYMFPKTSSVTAAQTTGLSCKATLGGTFIPDTEKLSQKELAELDHQEFQRLLDRNSLFFHGKRF